MGTVYLAEGPTGPVAIKVINPHLANDPEFRKRFQREVAAARRVRRFCTAPVLDANLDGDPLWVVTEYVAGPDLGRVLRENGPLSGSNIEALAVGVATALTAIHDAGLVHRDLKPANVLLSPLGPRVIDFGIARALDAGDGQTSTGKILGTPDYMAPELFRGEPVGPPADIFAWGCVVVAAATGASPFASKTVPQAFYRVVNEEPDLSRVDPGLRPIVAAALDKDPARRPTAQQLVDMLVRRTQANTADIAGTVRLDLSEITRPADAPATLLAPPADDGGRGGRGRRGGRGPLAYMAMGAGAALLSVALVAGAVFGVRALPSGGPPDSGDVMFQDGFNNEKSGWKNDGLTGEDNSLGYTGNGRYTIGVESYDVRKFAKAPVNAVLPDKALVSVTLDLSKGAFWTGVYCDYNRDSEDKYLYYLLEVNDQGQGKLVKVASGKWTDLTPDVTIPDFAKGRVPLTALCERSDREVRLAMWVGDHLVAEYTDTEADEATDAPEFGLYVEGVREGKSRAYFDDFKIARLT